MNQPSFLNEVREKIADRALIVLSLATPVILSLSLYRINFTGWDIVYLIHIVFLTSVIFMTFFRKKISLSTKAIFLISIFFISAVFGLFKFGSAGQGPILLIVVTMFSVTFYSHHLRSSVIVIPVIVILFTWAGQAYDFMPFISNVNALVKSPSTYAINAVFYALFLYLLLFTAGSFIHAIIIQTNLLNEEIAERKQIEEALRLTATAFETSEAILITDAKGVILSVNHACEVLTGYSAGELIGKRPNILASGKLDLQFYEAMWKTLINEGVWSGELINKRKSGEEYLEKLSITASKSPAGKTVNYIGVFSDISEKVELERQLRHSQKMESIGVLVGGIAHEFNNMLAAITGNLYLAKMKVEKECAIREKLDTAEKTCFKAAGLIKQLLVFARKDIAGNELTMVDMAEWLPEGVNLARSALSSDVELKCTIEKNDLIIKADTTELQQIVMNLINNARDASSHRDRPLIEIELSSGIASPEFRQRHKTFQGYEFVCLMLRDNGEGIPQDKLVRIFEPFYTTKEAGKGTGLGMAVIEGIINSMHGCIEVASEVGVGTTFNVYIPRQHSETIADEAKTQKAVPEELLQGHGETILIADDEAEVLSMISEVLHGLGYKVITACNGRDAVEQFKRNSQSIDMALLDVVMPELSGSSAAILMREINPDLPLLFLTGYNPDDRRSDMDELENYDVVAKPIRVTALSLMIRKLLD